MKNIALKNIAFLARVSGPATNGPCANTLLYVGFGPWSRAIIRQRYADLRAGRGALRRPCYRRSWPISRSATSTLPPKRAQRNSGANH